MSKRYCKHCGDEVPKTVLRGYQCNTCRNGLKRYNMNKLDMVKMHESQNGKCKLCGDDVVMFQRRKPNSGYIDHCHTTGDVRGILCHPCNTSLGYIERKNIAKPVIEYLK